MKKQFIKFVVLSLELSLLISNYGKIVNYIPLFKNPANTYYDSIIVSLVASFLFLALTETNRVLFSFVDKGSTALLLFYIKAWDIQARLDETIAKAYKFLMSAKIKWGPTLIGADRKIANVAEGLLAVSYVKTKSTTITNSEKKEIEQVLKQLIAEGKDEGFQSYNLKKFTTHCTAMALFTIKRYHDSGTYRLAHDQFESLRKSALHLLSSGVSLGWGTDNERTDDENLIRLFSTFWALRALNVWGFSSDEKYVDILSSLLNRVKDGKFGFFPNSPKPKTSTISLFLILLKEIENEHTRSIILEKLSDQKIKQLLKLLIKDLNTPMETEEYLRATNPKFERLAWTHFSFFLSISALSQYTNFLSPISYMQILAKISSVLKTEFHADGYYDNKKLDYATGNPLTYPTTYAIIGLSDFKDSLNQLHL